MPTENKRSPSKVPDKKLWLFPLLRIILLLLVFLLVLLLITNSYQTLIDILYSPFSFAILLIIVLEYVILKGVDRSRIYRLEIERLRSKRAEDIALWRDLEGHLSDALRTLQKLDDSAASASPDADFSNLVALRSKLEEILRILRKNT
jgi:hypothetical protein